MAESMPAKTCADRDACASDPWPALGLAADAPRARSLSNRGSGPAQAAAIPAPLEGAAEAQAAAAIDGDAFAVGWAHVAGAMARFLPSASQEQW
jgi:hypothetical protein